jgi:hypothetical protein
MRSVSHQQLIDSVTAIAGNNATIDHIFAFLRLDRGQNVSAPFSVPHPSLRCYPSAVHDVEPLDAPNASLTTSMKHSGLTAWDGQSGVRLQLLS